MQSLSVSRLIAVSVALTAAGARAQNLSTLLVLGSTPVIDSVERYRDYTSLSAVGLDFSSNTPEYLAAQKWFGQAPQPSTLKIGRWAKTAASGTLRGAVLSAQAQQLANFTAVTTGAFSYQKNGAAAVTVSALNFSGAANLNAVAAIITTALSGATMVWNASFQRFELTSTTTGPTSSISFLTAPGAGTDISALLGMTSGQGGYRADGLAAETALDAVTYFDANFGQSWYGLMMPEGASADHVAVATFVSAANNKHLYAVTTMDAGTLVAATTTDVASQLKALGLNKVMVQYSSSDGYAVASALAKMLTVNYSGDATAITLMYKQEPGVVAEQLNETQANALKAKNCNVFVGYENGTAILQYGQVSSGAYVDEITGSDWLAVTIQASIYNLLYTSPRKIPQTDEGMHLLTTAVEAVCSQGVTNGLLAPGVWNSAGFGAINQGDLLPKGFYVYAPRVATQDPADRAARMAVPIQVAAKLAGAIHTADVSVTVNQ